MENNKNTKRLKRGLKDSTSEGLKSQHYHPSLSPVQREVLHLLTVEFLTCKEIANRRKTSLQAVYKTVNALKRKGIINKDYREVEYSDHTPPRKSHKSVVNRFFRLHAQHWVVGLIFKHPKYDRDRSECNLIDFGTCKVRLNRNNIEVYLNKSFQSDDINKATIKSMEFLRKILLRLESDLGVILVKPRSYNIKLVQQHYAEIENEVAKNKSMSGKRFRIYAKEDGKLWFEIDNSFNLNEMETVHPETAKEDMENVQRHLNDIRDNNPATNSQIIVMLKELAKENLIMAQNNRETAAGLNASVTIMRKLMESANVQDGKVEEKSEDDPKKDFRREYIG